jgi:hypothetical protein
MGTIERNLLLPLTTMLFSSPNKPETSDPGPSCDGVRGQTAHIALDSDTALVCSWCGEPIQPEEPKVIYGVGSARYAMPYHPWCNASFEESYDFIFLTSSLANIRRYYDAKP